MDVDNKSVELREKEDLTSVYFSLEGHRHSLKFCRVKSDDNICAKCPHDRCRMIREICKQQELGINYYCPYILEHIVSNGE
jgi:hypothetical protein